MEKTLHDLGLILLYALPTFFLVLLLHVYLRVVLFKPLARTLEQRREATEGAREAAAASLDRAARKASEYEEALRVARNEIYREQEIIRAQWRDEQTARVAEARTRAEQLVKEAKAGLAAEVAQARTTLESQSRELADSITRTVLKHGAAAA